MKKFTLSFVLLLTTVLGISATETTIWEGTQAGNLDFTVDTELHTTLINNMKAGDVMNISYTGATADSKLWLQNSSWDTYPSSITGATVDLLTAGSGIYKVNISQDFIDAIKTGGLKLRRGGDAVYSFTKVTLTSSEGGEQPGGGDQPGDGVTGTIVVWEGSQAMVKGENFYIAPETDLGNKLFGDGAGQAALAAGDKIKFYYTGAEEGTEIWIQANWDGLSGEGSMPGISGSGDHTFYINAADLALIKTAGIRFRVGNGACTFTKIEVIKKEQSGGGTEGGITVWEGMQAGNLRFMPGDVNYEMLMSNLAGLDKLKIYYTGATEGDELWIQDGTDWSGIAGIEPNSLTFAAGDGSVEVSVSDNAVATIKEKGIVFHYKTGATYTMTKIEVIKFVPDASVLMPGDDEYILWSGSVKAKNGKAFRYGEERANFIAALVVGEKLNVYLSDVVAGNRIFLKETTTWSWVNEGKEDLEAGQQLYTIDITQEIIDKINNNTESDYGLLIQGRTGAGGGDADEYEIRFVTTTGKPVVDGIQRVENTTRNMGVAYNLQGQRVTLNAKGIIILNGKKVFNK